MPIRSRKRQSAGNVYETTPNVRQKHFLTANQTVRPKASGWSVPSKRQQTITQMDPFRSIFHPQLDQENLEYDEGANEEPNRGSKRRKLSTEETPVRRITRSAKKAITASSPAITANNSLIVPKSERSILKSEDTTIMPPPITPKPQRRKEIPSSQSPTESPLSSHRPRSMRDVSRSPLKEKSTNIVLRRPVRNSVQWRATREIPDSMGSEGDDIPQSPSLHSKDLATKCYQRSDSRGPRDCTGSTIHNRKREESSTNIAYVDPPGLLSIEADFINPDEADKIKGIFETSLETQVALLSADASNGSQHSVNEPCVSRKEESSQTPAISRPEDRISSTPKGSIVSNDPRANQDHVGRDDQLDTAGYKESFTPPSSPQLETESQEASNQLVNDLYRATQAQAIVETESQFENAWHSYHLPTPQDSDTQPSLHYASSPQTSNADSKVAAAPMTKPTQPLGPQDIEFIRPAKFPVPPSQATTVDVTQLSPRKPTQHSSYILRSSPPPMPPLTSSPVASRKVMDRWARYEWIGGGLTESQLLPASLMQDSLVGPPEAWAMEQEVKYE